MDMLNQFANIIAEIPFNRVLGLKLTNINAETLTLNFSMQDNLIGNFFQKILHGGVISSTLDMAGGAAAMVGFVRKNSHLSFTDLTEKLGKASTVNLHIDYLRPGKGEEFTIVSQLIRAGNKISVARMELLNETNTLIATGSGTYLLA